MNMLHRILLAALALVAAAAGNSPADDPAKAFLDALRDRGYYDSAINYLSVEENNPSVSASFKEILEYEKGTTLIQGAHLQRDSAEREKQLGEAQKVLAQFVKDKPGHLYAMAARNQLGSV